MLGLIAVAVLSDVLSVRFSTSLVAAGWDWCYLLALGFSGPTGALVVAWVTYLVSFAIRPFRASALLVNLGSIGITIWVSSVVLEALRDLDFTAAMTAATVTALAGQVVVVAPLTAALDGVRVTTVLREARIVLPAFIIQAGIAVTLAGVYKAFGPEAVAFAVVVVVGFAYMLQLLVQARRSATANANLSWGVLSGLLRTLDMRDPRAARHCAAVARLSRDIARQAGLSKTDQQLAHTAGLLHDIGKFALSDRVLNGEGLTEADWRGIRRHPAIGADLLRDISLYGPVGDIVGAHHERIDGRGYPHRLAGEDIPEIARIVAVAEVYDTLTAADTYRTPTTSFEALTILREASGRQFDGRFVEALALVLAGQDMAYRHAGDVDFDRELDIERRASEAART
ncbi:MAG: hypothetical protein JWO02_699 [Solirubrobacterales bacterium]|nr:hypothetical protein [Solirubrobacterales bacterium]